MRASFGFVLAVAAGALTGCAGGSGGARALEQEAACVALDRLAASAAPVEAVEISDPARFQAALEASIDEYLAALDDLREVVPDEFADDLDELEAAASQYRFLDALGARVALEDYEQATCGEMTTPTGATD